MNTCFSRNNSKLSTNNVNPTWKKVLKNNDTKLFISHNYYNMWLSDVTYLVRKMPQSKISQSEINATLAD